MGTGKFNFFWGGGEGGRGEVGGTLQWTGVSSSDGGIRYTPGRFMLTKTGIHYLQQISDSFNFGQIKCPKIKLS